jgi:hypothetical protein
VALHRSVQRGAVFAEPAVFAGRGRWLRAPKLGVLSEELVRHAECVSTDFEPVHQSSAVGPRIYSASFMD